MTDGDPQPGEAAADRGSPAGAAPSDPDELTERSEPDGQVGSGPATAGRQPVDGNQPQAHTPAPAAALAEASALAEAPASAQPPAAPVPAQARRRGPLWAVLAVVVVLLTCALPSVLLVGLVGGAAGRTATGDDAARRLAARMTGQLDRQAAALLGGDRNGFLAIAEPGARAGLTRRYAALRALRVTVWRPTPDGVPSAVAGRPGEWQLSVRVGYCFVVPGCAPASVLIGTRWRDVGEQLRLVAVEESRSTPAGARPWEVSDLAVAVGKRAVVATTPALRAKLPGLLAQAEAAAKVADLYAVGAAPPGRYLVFYAGRAEWRRWYGGGRPRWTAGYAVGVGGGHHDVVLNAESLSPEGVDDLLRHELTHAASLPDQGYSDRATWWLVEGLAEYAGADGQPVGRYEGLSEVRKLVRGGWTGRLDGLAPADDATDDRVGGSYGIGYLAVRHLVDRYGEQRVLDFFRAVIHDRRSVDEASDQVFGEQWSTLHDDCVAYVRAVAG
ncbi:hypothetical protein [Micromonospora sp. RTP1Z1]|uniref:hypothetical protein n=1 Tax=Micromonospora sp. RTP1Z1 TaxID=2994043 RepID=UPI0029C8BFBD|nr:hypothetical protein [Micromonospora sp. RTP1Z1]